MKDLFEPMLNVGCEKLNPPPAAPGCGAMGGVVEGAGDPDPAPKVNTLDPLFDGANELAPPN